LSGAIRLKPFIKQMYKAGAGSVIDTVAINSYATSDKDLGKLMNQMRKLINRSGGRSDKIWITEIGWCDQGVKSRFCVGSKNQKKYVRGALKLIKRKRTAWKLRGFVYFSWRDGRPYGSGDLWGLHTGLLSVKGKKKSVYNVFVNGVKGF
jgi:exo-beta-1,3-glucanase (GH17 family)